MAKIVGDHGGLIEVDSRPGRTELRLHLPVLAEERGLAEERTPSGDRMTFDDAPATPAGN